MQFARVSRYSIAPERMDEACETFREALSNLREIEGNEGGYFLVERDNGVAFTITFWGSGATLRRAASSAVEADIEAVEKYEVAVELG